jgi:hypothetical protein
MVDSTYYTFRQVSEHPIRFEVTRWSDTDKYPVCTYTVNVTKRFCSCRAVVDCRHLKACIEIVEADMADVIYQWVWDKENEWTRLNDIVPIEELIDATEGKGLHTADLG